jgi:hypothetical protein
LAGVQFSLLKIIYFKTTILNEILLNFADFLLVNNNFYSGVFFGGCLGEQIFEAYSGRWRRSLSRSDFS